MRIEQVEPCGHGKYEYHFGCDFGVFPLNRTVLDGFPPEAIEAAARERHRRWIIDGANPDDPDDPERNYYPELWDEMEDEDRAWYLEDAIAALDAAWRVLTGDTE